MYIMQVYLVRTGYFQTVSIYLVGLKRQLLSSATISNSAASLEAAEWRMARELERIINPPECPPTEVRKTSTLNI